jgi:anion-transporting  ArsA/GET3 family ATPase
MRPLEKRLLFVTGKGGVGKSTVAAALGVLGARRGLRTLVAEVSGRGDVPRMLGGAGSGPLEHELEPNLWTIAIDPQPAMEEYLLEQLRVRALVELLASSRTFSYLAAATPGMRELLTIGKVWELTQPERRAAGGEPYDLVVVDAPATGHGLAFLASASTFAAVAQVGRVARQASKIHATLTDPALTGVIVVSTPQEPAVNEAVELRRALRDELRIELDAVVVNALHPWRFTPRDTKALHAALDDEADPALREALELALAEEERVLGQRAQLRRLRDQVHSRGPELPFIFAPELGRNHLEELSVLLGAAL